MKARLLWMTPVILMASCVLYDPSLRIDESVDYLIPPAESVPNSVERVIVSAENEDELDIIASILGAVCGKQKLQLRFEIVDAKTAAEVFDAIENVNSEETNLDEAQSKIFERYDIDAVISGYCRDVGTEIVAGEDRNRKNILISIVEIFHGKQITDFNFSVKVEQEVPVSVYDEKTGTTVEKLQVQTVELPTDVMVLQFTCGFVMEDAWTGETLYQQERNAGFLYQLYERTEYDMSVTGMAETELVSEFPDQEYIKNVVRLESEKFFDRFISALSPSYESVQIEIYPIIGYENWNTVYRHLLNKEYERARGILLEDLSDEKAEQTIAQYYYVIGGIYNLEGNFDEALRYLRMAEKEITRPFRDIVRVQIDDIQKRKENELAVEKVNLRTR